MSGSLCVRIENRKTKKDKKTWKTSSKIDICIYIYFFRFYFPPSILWMKGKDSSVTGRGFRLRKTLVFYLKVMETCYVRMLWGSNWWRMIVKILVFASNYLPSTVLSASCVPNSHRILLLCLFYKRENWGLEKITWLQSLHFKTVLMMICYLWQEWYPFFWGGRGWDKMGL